MLSWWSGFTRLATPPRSDRRLSEVICAGLLVSTPTFAGCHRHLPVMSSIIAFTHGSSSKI